MSRCSVSAAAHGQNASKLISLVLEGRFHAVDLPVALQWLISSPRCQLHEQQTSHECLSMT